jgi:hypothetical protein
MEEFIYEKKHALTNELCDDIINNNNNIKLLNNNTICNNSCLYNSIYFKEIRMQKNIINSIIDELKTNLKFLMIKYNNILSGNFIILDDNWELLKLEKNRGFISYSYDFNVILESTWYSGYDFVIFLNDNTNDCSIEIMGKIKIKSEKGKLLLIPSGWCFPYSFKTPLSEDNYIIRGKIFYKKPI